MEKGVPKKPTQQKLMRDYLRSRPTVPSLSDSLKKIKRGGDELEIQKKLDVMRELGEDTDE